MPRARFPSFDQLLSSASRRRLASGRLRDLTTHGDDAGRVWLGANLFDPGTSARCVRMLDRELFPLCRVVSSGVPSRAALGLRQSHTETLPKAMRVRSAFLHPGTRAQRKARELGILDFLDSDGLHRFAETVSGLRLVKGYGEQVLCYEAGDYVSPHTDHHPEIPELRDGYVDVHLMFSNRFVGPQFLGYETRGHLGGTMDISHPTAAAVYRLPFWHYTTPLVARPGTRGRPRRWILLASYAPAGARRRGPSRRRHLAYGASTTGE